MNIARTLKNSLAAFIAALPLASGVASATPVSYYGAIFDLSIADIGLPGFTYQVTYTADFTNFTNGAAQPYIDSIAWKHAGEDVATAFLVSDPGFGWITSPDSTVNASGCGTSGGNTWACAQDYFAPYVPTAGLLSWVFWVSFSDPFLESLNTTGDSIKARFVDASGNKQGALLSCKLDDIGDDNCDSSVSVPEPTTLAIFGLGLLGLAAARRRLVRK